MIGIVAMTRSLITATGLLVAAGPAHAATPSEQDGRIRIDHIACTDRVSLRATNVPLSEVMQALAARLEFELRFKSDNDREITVEIDKPARALIQKLGKGDNIMISSRPDERCADPVERLTTVWFLGKGPEVSYQPVAVEAIDELPETGMETGATVETTEPVATDNTEAQDPDKADTRNPKRDMSPEERFNEKLRRKAEKGRP